MALQEIQSKLCDKQKTQPGGFTAHLHSLHPLFQRLVGGIKTCRFTMTCASPGDVTRSLLVSLHVCYRAVTVAERLHPHQVVAAVARLPRLVEVGEGSDHVGQRTEVPLTWILLLWMDIQQRLLHLLKK